MCVCFACVVTQPLNGCGGEGLTNFISVREGVHQNLISNSSALHISESHLENDAMATIIITMCHQLALGRRKRSVCWWLLNVSFEPHDLFAFYRFLES